MDLNVTILYKLVDETQENSQTYMPVKFLCGYYHKETNIFEDILSDRNYLDLSISNSLGVPEGFREVKSFKEVCKFVGKNSSFLWNKINSYKYFFSVLEEYWNVSKKNVICFENGEERVLSVRDYKNQTKCVKFLDSQEYNDYLDKLINDDISVSTYLDKVYNNSNFVRTFPGDLDYNCIQDVCDFVERRVFHQSSAIKQLVTSIFRSRIFKGEKNKTCSLLVGPTGVGKTEIVESISKCLDIPVTKINASRLTDNGYKGFNPDDIILNIYLNADEDIERAEKSIVFIDEIDKKVVRDNTDHSFNKTDVLNALLKMVEGDVYYIENKKYDFRLDTSNMIFIFAGAFTDIYDTKFKRIGFASENSEIMGLGKDKDITVSDLESYGVPIEFLGRIREIITLNKLTKDDLLSILLDGELSPMKYYIDNFRMLGVDLVIPRSAYDYVVDKAYALGTNARALSVFVDEIFKDILFEVFTDKSIHRVEIDEQVISDSYKYSLFRKG